MTILCYHTVERGWRSPLAVTPETFSEHCRWLSRHRRVRSVAEAVERLGPSGLLPKGLTALTFDDGFSGLYEHAFPILERHRLPALVFLVAETLTPEGKRVDWSSTCPPDATTLNIEQVREMQDAGVSFGSHSYSHRDLVTLSEQECEHDLTRSKQLLEELLGRPVPFLAYPFGHHDDKVRRAARRAGYSHALALPEGLEPFSPHSVPRVVIVPGNGVISLRAKTSRLYLPLRRTRLFPALRVAARKARLDLRVARQ